VHHYVFLSDCEAAPAPTGAASRRLAAWAGGRSSRAQGRDQRRRPLARGNRRSVRRKSAAPRRPFDGNLPIRARSWRFCRRSSPPPGAALTGAVRNRWS